MNNAENNAGKLFRDSMRGFNKSDVIKFIENLNENFIGKEQKYKQTISELESKLAAAENASGAGVSADASGQLAGLQAALAAKTAESGKAAADWDQLNGVYNQLASDYNQLVNDYNQVSDNYNRLSGEYNQLLESCNQLGGSSAAEAAAPRPEQVVAADLPADNAELDQLTARYNQLVEDYNNLGAAYSQQAEQVAAANAAPQQDIGAQDRIAELRAQLDAKNNEFERVRAQSAEAAAQAAGELDRLSARINELQSKLGAEQADRSGTVSSINNEYFQKAMQYDRVSEKIGGVLLTAEQTAAGILDRASRDGERIVNELRAKGEAEYNELRGRGQAEYSEMRARGESEYSEMREKSEAEYVERRAKGEAEYYEQVGRITQLRERYDRIASYADYFKTYTEQSLPTLVGKLGELDGELKQLSAVYRNQAESMAAE